MLVQDKAYLTPEGKVVIVVASLDVEKVSPEITDLGEDTIFAAYRNYRDERE
jgi:hypothetical protein